MDHSAYLLGAKNGERLRYEGLKSCADYKKGGTDYQGWRLCHKPDLCGEALFYHREMESDAV